MQTKTKKLFHFEPMKKVWFQILVFQIFTKTHFTEIDKISGVTDGRESKLRIEQKGNFSNQFICD